MTVRVHALLDGGWKKDGARLRLTSSFRHENHEAEQATRGYRPADAPDDFTATFSPERVETMAKTIDRNFDKIAAWTRWMQDRAEAHLEYAEKIARGRERMQRAFAPEDSFPSRDTKDKVYFRNGGLVDCFSEDCRLTIRLTYDEAERVMELLRFHRSGPSKEVLA